MEFFTKALNQILLVTVYGYQFTVGKLKPPTCRFYPSCSHYAVHVLKKDNSIVAVAKIVKRLFRCHPFHPGGVDLP